MRTKTDIYNDMAAAIMTAYSTDHSRALSGAEWLQQLATELVDAIKAEQPEPLADVADDASQLLDMDGVSAPDYQNEQAGPGDGWRWLEPGEVIKRGDEHEFLEGEWRVVLVSIGCKAESKAFRRRIEKL